MSENYCSHNEAFYEMTLERNITAELVPTVGHTRPAQLKRKWFPSGLWYSLIGHKHFSQAEPFSPGGAAWIILH